MADRRPKRDVAKPANYAEDASDEESELGKRAAAREQAALRRAAPGPEPMAVELTDYERERLANIRSNRELLAKLGLDKQRRAGEEGGSDPSASGEEDKEEEEEDDDEVEDDANSSSSSDGYDAGAARRPRASGGGARRTPAKPKSALKAPASARAPRAGSASAGKGAGAGKRAPKRKGAEAAGPAAGSSDAPIDLDAHGEQARALFGEIDTEGVGLLTVERIVRAARSVQLGQIDELRAQQMVEVFDKAGKGGLDVDDLMMLIARPDMRSVFTA